MVACKNVDPTNNPLIIAFEFVTNLDLSVVAMPLVVPAGPENLFHNCLPASEGFRLCWKLENLCNMQTIRKKLRMSILRGFGFDGDIVGLLSMKSSLASKLSYFWEGETFATALITFR